MTIRTAIIILAWNGEAYLDACLQAVLAQADESVEIIVVDNASTDRSAEIAKRYAPRVRLIQNDDNLGFAGGNNVGLRATTAEIVVLLNQDTVVQSGWLAAIAETFADPAIGIVGCKALYPDGRTIQHAGARVKPGTAFTEHIGLGELDEGQYDHLADMEYVTGASFAIHRRVLECLGGLDERYFPAFYEEVDYCCCARRADFRVVYQPRAVFYHHETASLSPGSFSTQTIWHRHRIRFVLRHWDRPELESFAQAERDAIPKTSERNDMMARARAYFDALLALPQIAVERRANRVLGGSLSLTDQRFVAEFLKSLRRQTLAHLLHPVLNSGVDNFARLNHLLHEFETQVVFHEQHVPVSPLLFVGPAITWIRKQWLAVMVKPYLIPIMAQVLQVAQELSAQSQRQETMIRQQLEILDGDDAVLMDAILEIIHNAPRLRAGDAR